MRTVYPQATRYQVPVGYMGGYPQYGGSLAAIDTITATDIVRRLNAVDYFRSADTPPPVTPPYTPPYTPPVVFTKAQAIACGVSRSLGVYGLNIRCNTSRCEIPQAKYDQIVNYAGIMARNAQASGKCPWRYIYGLSGLGDDNGDDRSWWDAWGVGIVTSFGTFLVGLGQMMNAKKVEQNLLDIAKNRGVMVTQSQLAQMVAAAMAANPGLTGGNKPAEAEAFPNWMKYGLIAGGAVLVVTMLKK